MKRLGGLILSALFLLSAALPFAALPSAAMEPDPEVHRVVGGLYALAAAAGLHGGKDIPTPAQLQRCFTNTLTAQVAATGDGWWVGVPVGRFSSARRFLRAHAPKLEIMDGAGGRPWMGGDTAWLKAASVTGKEAKASAKPLPLQAAQGAGDDARLLFLSADGAEWWQAPAMTDAAREAALKRWGTSRAPELHAPAGAPVEEKLSASPVGLPEDMHTGATSDDLSLEVGDVLFKPLPRVRNN